MFFRKYYLVLLSLILILLSCDDESGTTNTPTVSASDASTGLCITNEDCDRGFSCQYGICMATHQDAGLNFVPDASTAYGQIKVDKQTIEFGAVTFGSTTVRSVVVSNIGTGPLSILEIVIRDDPNTEFQVLFGDSLPYELAPGEQIAAMVVYSPSDNFDDRAKLVFVSDDPNQVLLEVPLLSEFKGVAASSVVSEPLNPEATTSTLDFGSVPTTGSLQKKLYVLNGGTGVNPILGITGIELDPRTSLNFSITTSTVIPTFLNPYRLDAVCGPSKPCPQGHTCDSQGLCRPLIELLEITITFSPQNIGNIQERLLITSQAGGASTQQDTTIVDIRGQGVEASIFVDPQTIALGTVFVGQETTQPLNISNTGGASLTVNSLSYTGQPDLDVSGVSFPYTLAPAEVITATVSLRPSTTGILSETITIRSSDLNTPEIQVAVTATRALSPRLESQNTVNFGEMHIERVGSVPLSQNVIITNSGGSDLQLLSVDWAAGTPSDFLTPSITTSLIPPGGTATINVGFQARNVGVQSARLQLVSNDPNQMLTEIVCAGEGIDPTISVSPTNSIDLGSVYPGAISPTATVSISNTGIGALILTDIRFSSGSSPDFTVNQNHNFPLTIAPNGQTTFTVLYQPSSVGPDSGAIEIVSSDLDSPLVTLALYGQGTECPLNTWDIDGDPNNGCEYVCTPTSPPVEACNGQDDDCDGETDEGFMLGQSCTGRGACGAGSFECSTTIAGAVACSTESGQSQDQTSTESCNQADDDCDGIIDNGFDLASDLQHCGQCNQLCTTANATPECVSGQCRVQACNSGFDDCDNVDANGCETQLNSDSSNCGACGSVCNPPNATGACQNGQCTISQCDTGFEDCDNDPTNGCEVDLRDSTDNCGSCGNECNIANGASICQQSQCVIGSCDSGYGDCDGLYTTGCEQPLNTLSHCGQCGQVCTAQNASVSCSTGICMVGNCDPGFGDCDSSVVNGCETPIDTPTNCGSCGTSCGINSLCCTQSCRAASAQDCGSCGDVCSPGELVITEVMIDPAAVSDAQGEWFELYNTSTRSMDIRGFTISDLDSDSHIITSAAPIVIPPGQYISLGRNTNQSTNGGANHAYQYGGFTLGNSGDEVVLSAFGTEIDRIEYPSNFDVPGASKQLSADSLTNTANDNLTLWCTSTSAMSAGDFGTPGLPNAVCQ